MLQGFCAFLELWALRVWGFNLLSRDLDDYNDHFSWRLLIIGALVLGVHIS